MSSYFCPVKRCLEAAPGILVMALAELERADWSPEHSPSESQIDLASRRLRSGLRHVADSHEGQVFFGLFNDWGSDMRQSAIREIVRSTAREAMAVMEASS